MQGTTSSLPHYRFSITAYIASLNLAPSSTLSYATSKQSPAPQFSNSIPVTDDDLAVILVKRSTTGYQLLGVTTDDDLVVRQNSLHLQTTTYLPKLFSCS